MQKPVSSTNFKVCLFSCVLFFTLFFMFYDKGEELSNTKAYLILLISIVPLILHDLMNCSKIFGENAIPFSSVRKFNLERVVKKLAGLGLTYLFVCFLYWLFPIYNTLFFKPYWGYLKDVMPYLAIFTVPYFVYVDTRMKNPEDAYFQMGNVALLNFKDVDARLIWEHLKCWIVKAFYIGLMTVYFAGNLRFLVNFDFGQINTAKAMYDFSYNFMFTIDLLFAVIGYICTFKIFNTQIHSTEPTVRGWVVCLMGYAPFWGELLYRNYFAYDDDYYWGDMLWNNHDLYVLWGCAIIFCLFVYAMATVAFGMRFSNLTYRGLITSGPYAFTKHPAYVSKNISWWLVSIPFIPTHGWENALRTCILLFGVNIIYYLRARTEENHLSNYPEYVAYAEYMNEHSVFRWVPKLLPFTKYSKERAFKSGSKVYKPFV